MKLQLDLGTMLDIALGGPEIGPLNLHVLHSLMRQLFHRMNMSKQHVVVDRTDPEFQDSYDFIQSKLETMPKSASGGYKKLR